MIPRPLLCVLSSAALLIVAFPNFNQPWCAWIALVPWLVALQGATPRQAFGRSYLVGLVFFLGSMWWLIHLTAFGGPAAILGWLVLSAYLALYFAAFGWFASRAIGLGHGTCPPRHESHEAGRGDMGHGTRSVSCLLSPVSCLIVIPSLWVTLEFLRSHLLSGFGWNLLGYSQASWLPIIQIAEATSVWGVSFLIVLVNVAIASTLRARRLSPLAAAGACVLAAWGYGVARLHPAPQKAPSVKTERNVGRQPERFFPDATAVKPWGGAQPPSAPSLKVAVVQGNIPQEQKWDEAAQASILQRYERLTHEVASPAAGDTPSPAPPMAGPAGTVPARSAASRPDLIIWPETSVPGLVGWDHAVMRRVQQLAQAVQIPLLVGAPSVAPHQAPSQGGRLFNSALLLDRQGIVVGRYDKVHLVPFGEFIPGESFAPWLRAVLPPIGDFVPGREYTIFSIRNSEFGIRNDHSALRTPHSALKFGVLICFEDIFPQLARRFVQRGAQMLVVITNDAWFGKTAAAYQHAQASTFRAVELRVPVVRAANTGWSGCITDRGQRVASVRGAEGQELFVEGIAVCDVAGGAAPTLYEQWGDWFAWVCLGACLVGSLFGIIKAKRSAFH